MDKESTIANIKAFIEANNALDAGALPPHLLALPALATWLSKALAAREASIAHYKEVKNVDLEKIA